MVKTPPIQFTEPSAKANNRQQGSTQHKAFSGIQWKEIGAVIQSAIAVDCERISRSRKTSFIYYSFHFRLRPGRRALIFFGNSRQFT